MPQQSFKKALDLHADRREKNNKSEQNATVVSVAAGIARIRIKGSNQTQDAIVPAGMDIQYNDEVRLTRTKSNSRVRWVVDAVISVRATGQRGVQSQYMEIFPPDGITVIDGLPGMVTVRWNAPVTMPVAFEVQTADDSSGTNAVTEFTTRGSYAIIPASSNRYFRIRSTAHDGQQSAWSDWTLAEPGESAVTSPGEPVTYCGLPVWYNGEQVFYDPD